MRRVRKWADDNGIPSVRMALLPGVASGFPDVMFLPRCGRAVFVEFKSPGRKPTRLQAAWVRRLSALGYRVHVVDDVALGIAFLQETGR